MVPALAGPLCLGVPGGHGRVRCGRGGGMDDRIVGGGPLGERQRGDHRGPKRQYHDAEGEADRHFAEVGEQHLGAHED
jgi:hypothetical protein